MSIWGKVIGGAAGFALGGPIGALLGATAGHMVDRLRDDAGVRHHGAGPYRAAEARQIAFTVGVIVLGAKLAKADGVVTKDEIAVFKRVFRIPADEAGDVGAIFNEARQSAHGYEPYARQIAQLFHANPVVLEELLDALFLVARADGVIHPAELDYLRRVAEIFGFDAASFEPIHARHKSPDETDPYEILGVPHDISNEAVKARHRKLVLENHPDKLTAQGVPEEFIEVANEKLARINEAYDRIRAQRGLR